MATTVIELGQKLKAKHPGEYDDLTDADVGRRLKARYPGEYDDFVDVPVGMEKLGALPGGPKVPLPRAPGDPFSMDLNQSASISTFGGTGKPRAARSSTVTDATRQAAPPSTARRNPRTGLPMPPGSGPLKILDWTPEGTQEAAQGVAQMSDWDAEGTSQTPKPTPANQLLGGGSKVFRGSMKAAAPALLPYGAIAYGPGAMATGLVVGGAAGAGTEASLNALNVSPEKSAAAGDVANVLFGMGAGSLYGPTKGLYDIYSKAKIDPKLAKILLKGVKLPLTERGFAGQLYDYFHPEVPEPKPFSPPVPPVRPQGQGLPGFPKPPEIKPFSPPVPGVTYRPAASEPPRFNPPVPPVTYRSAPTEPPRFSLPVPPVTPQGSGLSGFPKPPGASKPWPVPPVTYPGRTAAAAAGESGFSPTEAQIQAEINRVNAQQGGGTPPGATVIPRTPEMPDRYHDLVKDYGKIRAEQTWQKDYNIARHMGKNNVTDAAVDAMPDAELDAYMKAGHSGGRGLKSSSRPAAKIRSDLKDSLRELGFTGLPKPPQ